MVEKAIKCKWCGKETTSIGTKMCDSCWELETRINNDLELAKKIIKRIENRD